ncbi:acireductone synthase [Nonomuraea sp. NPDC048916]|uniref:acireductone synthase n=1 Tax=Nonomuraea sp. NPDC048916 TaxID=3154232 RepID=UPI0033D50B22
MIRHVVLDIEGTTSSLSHVRDQLFPYSRRRVHTWLRRPESARIVAELRDFLSQPRADLRRLGHQLVRWIDDDVKVPPLKTLQGLIWQDGFASGELTSHVYDDVPAALESWREQGLTLHVYSSGSQLAQRLWFRHTQHGDLRWLFRENFDTVVPGPKTDPESYFTIASVLETEPETIVFLSDSVRELDAARAAGWWTVGVRRDGDGEPFDGGHPWIATLDELDLTTDLHDTLTGGRGAEAGPAS